MVAVEEAWLGALVATGVAPAAARRPGRRSSAPTTSRGSPPRPSAAATRRSRSWPCSASGLARRTRGRPLAAPRADQPGRPRHGAVLCLRDGLGRAAALDSRARSGTLPTWPTAHRDTPMVGAHAHPARRTHHLRAQGGHLAAPASSTPPTTSTRCACPSSSAAPPARWPRRRARRRHRRRPAASSSAADGRRLGLAPPSRGTPPAPPLTRARRRAGHAAPTPGAASPATC